MKNRPLKATKEIPTHIRREYESLMWYQRALDELERMDTSRSLDLASRIKTIVGFPSGLCHGTTEPSASYTTDPLSQVPPEDDVEIPWIHRQALSVKVAEWVSNVTNGDVLFGAFIAALISIAMWVYVHPN